MKVNWIEDQIEINLTNFKRISQLGETVLVKYRFNQSQIEEVGLLRSVNNVLILDGAMLSEYVDFHTITAYCQLEI